LQYLLQFPEPVGIERNLFDAGDIRTVAKALEAAGWDGLAFTEHPAPSYRWLAEGGGHQTLDPFVALGAAAAVTERIMLLTYLAVAPYRNPLLLAKTAATVDLISNERLVLGLGTGYQKSEFMALGVDFNERNELFDEVLDVLPLHWSGKPFSYAGKHFSAREVAARPAPRRQIPIWIGGNAKLTRRRVAARAQGWMPMSVAPEVATTTRTAHLDGLAEIGTAIRELKEQAGERADQIDVMVMYTDPSILEPGTDVERHRDQLGRIAEIGATWVAFVWEFATQQETLAFIDGFGENYLGANRL
jgi:probable F420-dependent oxidoreductase